MKLKHLFILALILSLIILPDMALAADVAGLFKGPLQKIIDLLTGTMAGLMVALAVIVAGIAYVINKDDGSGWVMWLVRIAIGGIMMVGGAHIANWWFG